MKLLQAFLFTFIFSAVAFAQTTGSLRGQVVDQNGAVVPNATVVATNGSGIEKTVVSNAKGEYNVTGLPAGTYTVRVNAESFADYENTEVIVKAGQREELIITLTVAIASETVTVGGEQINAEPENNASATVLKGEDLEALPEDPDELASALQALAGSSAGPNGGQLYIDGFTGGRLPPREAIREIRINQNPFSSEFERPGFGRIEILTKPGADRLRGQAFFNFNDESLNSRNPFAPNRAPSQTRFYGGNVSGPIIKNKASFFIDIDNRQIDDNAVINATVLDANLNPTLFAESLIVPTRRFSISPRFDYAINDRNTLVARYSFQRNTADNRGIGEFSLPSLAFNTENTEHNIQLTETAILAPNIVNETRFQYNRQRNTQDGDNSIPTISVSGSFVGGGSSIGLNYTNEDRYELQNHTTWTLGKHNLRFGARLRGINLENRSESNFAGTFTFTGRPFVADNPATPVNEELPALSSLQQYRSEVSGGNIRSNPNQFTITAGDPLASISQTDFGVFINDDWRVNPGLTLSFGLRYEAQTNVSNNVNFAPRFGFAYSPGAGGAKPPKTVFRGGFGLFYDRIGENLSLNEVRFDGQRQLSYTVTDSVLLAQPVFTLNGVTNVPTIEQIAAVAPGSSTIRRLSDDIRSPFTMNGAFSVERQLPFRTTLSATYLMTRSYNLLRQRNVNAPVCSPLTACPVGSTALNALRPDSTAGNIYEYESTGEFNQQQLLIGFNTRFNPKISLFGNYRLSRAKSDVDGGGGFGFGFGGAGLGGFPLYSYDLSDEYGNSTQDIRHFAFIGGSVEVPFGIRLNPFITIRSGSPFNIITGFDRNGDGQFTERPTFAELGSRCQMLGLTSSFCDISDADPNAIIPRNYGRGPGSFNVNLNMTKTFGFGGSRRSAAVAAGGQTGQGGNNAGIPGVGGGGRRGGGGGGRGGRGGQGGGGFGQGGGNSDNPYNLTFGLQISNLFNNVNTGNPINNLSSPRFGQFNSLGGFGGFGGGGGSNAGNRRVTLQVRFSF